MELRDQVALVTGASRGIGRACALALARLGAAVVVNYRTGDAAARQVVKLIAAEGGGRAMLHQADVADPGACRRMVEATVEQYGRLDILVNNAGTSVDKLLIDTTLAEWEEQMAVHLRGMFVCTQSALPAMLDRGYGRIVTVSSIWGISGAAGEVAYSTAKAGQLGFTKALAQEVGRRGVTVNAVAPGWIQTDMNTGLTTGAEQEFVARTPVGRIGTPDEVADVVCFLASPRAGFITGQVWSPNGGILV